jgi:aminoglycoside phosphotransferase family enzyme
MENGSVVDVKRQTGIFLAMEKPTFYPHPAPAIKQRETHISKVFLTVSYVYKIKKPLDLELSDFTITEKQFQLKGPF